MVQVESYTAHAGWLNEVRQDESNTGSFWFKGPPLKLLLELAVIQKAQTEFSKLVDIAIVIRNDRGEQVVLSWGELFYRKPADVIVAIDATPSIPHTPCTKCHTGETYKSRCEQLSRKIDLPKLIVCNDFYSDRSIEGITDIVAVDLAPDMKRERKDPLFSPGFEITGDVKNTLSFNELSAYPHEEVLVKNQGTERDTMASTGSKVSPLLFF